MRAYILHIGGLRNQNHNPGGGSAMLYQPEPYRTTIILWCLLLYDSETPRLPQRFLSSKKIIRSHWRKLHVFGPEERCLTLFLPNNSLPSEKSVSVKTTQWLLQRQIFLGRLKRQEYPGLSCLNKTNVYWPYADRGSVWICLFLLHFKLNPGICQANKMKQPTCAP